MLSVVCLSVGRFSWLVCLWSICLSVCVPLSVYLIFVCLSQLVSISLSISDRLSWWMFSCHELRLEAESRGLRARSWKRRDYSWGPEYHVESAELRAGDREPSLSPTLSKWRLRLRRRVLGECQANSAGTQKLSSSRLSQDSGIDPQLTLSWTSDHVHMQLMGFPREICGLAALN